MRPDGVRHRGPGGGASSIAGPSASRAAKPASRQGDGRARSRSMSSSAVIRKIGSSSPIAAASARNTSQFARASPSGGTTGRARCTQ